MQIQWFLWHCPCLSHCGNTFLSAAPACGVVSEPVFRDLGVQTIEFGMPSKRFRWSEAILQVGKWGKHMDSAIENQVSGLFGRPRGLANLLLWSRKCWLRILFNFIYIFFWLLDFSWRLKISRISRISMNSKVFCISMSRISRISMNYKVFCSREQKTFDFVSYLAPRARKPYKYNGFVVQGAKNFIIHRDSGDSGHGNPKNLTIHWDSEDSGDFPACGNSEGVGGSKPSEIE